MATHTDDEFTKDDLNKLNELNEKKEKKKEIKEKLDESEEKELKRLQINLMNSALMDECGCCMPKHLKWNEWYLVIEALKTDVIIEYSKIGMIDYPGVPTNS